MKLLKNEPTKMNLQLFAEGEPQEEPKEPEHGATGDEPTEQKPLTLEEVQKMIQSENDKIRTEYSKKLKSLEKEKEELEKEKMTEDEKAKFELEKLQKELQDKEVAIKTRELTIKTVDLLKENDLPLEFREFVIGNDEDSTVKKVDTFKSLWNEAIQKAVDGRFKEGGREIKKATTDSTMTKEEFNKLSYSEKVKVYNDQPELYKQLNK